MYRHSWVKMLTHFEMKCWRKCYAVNAFMVLQRILKISCVVWTPVLFYYDFSVCFRLQTKTVSLEGPFVSFSQKAPSDNALSVNVPQWPDCVVTWGKGWKPTSCQDGLSWSPPSVFTHLLEFLAQCVAKRSFRDHGVAQHVRCSFPAQRGKPDRVVSAAWRAGMINRAR